jgi:RND family efflux transporter MFP subunit
VAEVRRLEDAPHRPTKRGRWGDTVSWREFAEATSVEGFYRGWLGVQCRLVGGVGGVAFGVGEDGSRALSPLAAWGSTRSTLRSLTEAARHALAKGERIVARHDTESGRRCAVAFPVQADGRVVAAVALDLAARPEHELRGALRQLEWGCGWLDALALRQSRPASRPAGGERLQAVLDLVASAQGHERFAVAATAFVTELATKLGCDRVSIGFLTAGRARVPVVSHTAHLGNRTNLLQAIGAAMDEAIDQKTTIVFPSDPAAHRVCRAHGELARQGAGGSICTVPFASGERLVGALTLERPHDRPFDRGAIDLVEAVAGLAGPGLDVLRREDRWLPAKAVEAGRRFLERLLGPGQLALKVGTLAVLAALAFLAFAKGEYRVSARAVMEGVVRRAAVSPFDGYLREAPVRAGDVVREGQVLAVLDDRELRLERAKLQSERDQLERQRGLALAEGNAAQTNIARAQIDQALARIALLDDQLGKTRVVAGFDGVVVLGDLSQALGSPVDKGQVLFEIAPLDSYRLVLEVDERDVAEVASGQRGQLLLVSAPADPVPFEVEKILPVSDARDGRNFFRVEATLERTPERLRPGMEGVAKIEIDRRRLAAIWTRSAIDWARLAFWTWAP